jgi:Protein of unknown function (DUF998)
VWRGAGTEGVAVGSSAVGATAEAGTGTATARASGDARAANASAATRPRNPRSRAVAVWIFGIAGLAAYNWWLLVPLKPGLMTSPDELFSNLEVAGQPYAAVMQHCDLASGLLLLAAFAVTGPGAGRPGRREWLSMLAFAVAGALGGLFPEVCADGIKATCRREEWRFELPAAQYIHVVAGIFEFAAITFALVYAVRRSRTSRSGPARFYRGLAWGAVIGYPLLGAAYLTDRLGAIMEGVFFVGFTIMVATQLADRTRALAAGDRQSAEPVSDTSGNQLGSLQVQEVADTVDHL